MLTTFPYDSDYGRIVNEAMMKAERLYTRDLITRLDDERVPGAIVEFGVANGDWLETLANIRIDSKSSREVWGFDSFEGLPATTEHDLDCWKEGDYAHDFEAVSARLRTAERPWLKLRKGWFAETLPAASMLEQIAFARIDCDLHQPAVECLEFLTARLSSGAVLVFDDWTYDIGKGETKAFLKWSASHPSIQVEHLHSNSIGHFYFRIRR